MHHPGVDVRPLRMSNGAPIQRVFFNDVFVPDDDVVGHVDSGWTVARATSQRERQHRRRSGHVDPGSAMIEQFDAHPERLSGGAERLGRYTATTMRSDCSPPQAPIVPWQAVVPARSAMAKLILSESGHEAAAIFTELSGRCCLMVGDGAMSNLLVLVHRACPSRWHERDQRTRSASGSRPAA